MTTTTTPSRVEGDNVVALTVPTLRWALKRTLLAIVILTVSIGAAACLLYASIDPEAESPAATPADAVPLSTGQAPAATGKPV
jgi:hypothetical protein